MVFSQHSFFLLSVGCLILGVRAAPTEKVDSYLNLSRVIFGEESRLTIAQKNGGVWHMEPDRFTDEPSILFSWGSSLKTSYDLSPIVGSIDVRGYAEGTGQDAKFNELVSFLQISKTQVIAVDRSNHCVRSIDRTTATTSSFAGKCGERGYLDGIGENVRFFEPSDILLDERNNKSLIIVDCRSHTLRGLNVDTREVTTIIQNGDKLNRARSATFDINDKNIIYVTSRFKVVKFSFADNSLEEISGDWQVNTFADSSLESERFGYTPTGITQLSSTLLAVADYWNQDVQLIDLKIKQVSSLCHPRINDSFIEGVGCEFYYPHGLLYFNNTLYVGESSSIRMLPVSFVEAGKSRHTPCQPRHLTAELSMGKKTVEVKVDANHTLVLSAGQHEFQSKGCTVYISVKGPKVTCPPSINRLAHPVTKKAVIDLMVYGVSQRFQLPVGQYPYTLKIDDLTCQLLINVYDSNIERRVAFEAKYDYNCTGLDVDVTRYLVESMVENNFIHIMEVCNGVCTRKRDTKPEMTCTNGTLSALYLTNLAYDGDVVSVPQDTYEKLTAGLSSKGTMMSIVDSSKTPPVVFPQANPDGSSASVILETVCLNNKKHDKATDTCV